MKNKKQSQKEILEHLQRLQAEFENYKKRTEKEQEIIKDYAKAQLLTKLLQIADNLERAQNQEPTKEVLEIIHKQTQKLLQEEQVTQIKSQGEKLDPYKHEVMLQEEGEEDDIIIQELQTGYMYKDKVLRPSRVKISKKSEGEEK